jgi:hypothetical protein
MDSFFLISASKFLIKWSFLGELSVHIGVMVKYISAFATLLIQSFQYINHYRWLDRYILVGSSEAMRNIKHLKLIHILRWLAEPISCMGRSSNLLLV